MGWEFEEVVPKDSRVPAEAAEVPHPSSTTGTLVTGSHKSGSLEDILCYK